MPSSRPNPTLTLTRTPNCRPPPSPTVLPPCFHHLFVSSISISKQQTLNFSKLGRMNKIGNDSGKTFYKVLHQPTGRLFAIKVIYGKDEDDVRRQFYRQMVNVSMDTHPDTPSSNFTLKNTRCGDSVRSRSWRYLELKAAKSLYNGIS